MAGEIQLNSVSLATESGSAITLGSAVSLNSAAYASTSEVQGTHTTFSGSHSDTATTINLASVSGISAGDYVVGEGIATGTTVSSVGASSVVISAGLDTDSVGIAGGEPISFYKSNKVLSPGLVAGGLCRAWLQIDGTTTPTITASYNISSVADTASGIITVTFLTSMPDAKYAVLTTGTRNDPESAYDQSHAEELNTTYYKIRTGVYSTGAVTTDFDLVSSAVFR